MKLNNFLNLLASGELVSTSFVDKDKRTIKEKELPIVYNTINSVLIDIFSRFDLLEKQLTIVPLPEISLYHLTSEHAEVGTNYNLDYPEVKPKKETYIKDTKEFPFLDDIVKILKAYDQDGNELPINDEHNDMSINVVSFDTIQIPFPADKITQLNLVYQASHELIPFNLTKEDAEKFEIRIPIRLVRLVRLGVLMSLVQVVTNQQSVAMVTAYTQAYEVEMQKLIADDAAANEILPSNRRLEQKGFI